MRPTRIVRPPRRTHNDSEHPEQPGFWERSIMTVASLVITGATVMIFMLGLPAAVDQVTGQGTVVVAVSKGVEQ